MLGAISGATTGLLTSFLQIVGFSMLTMGIPGLSISLSMVAIVFVSFALYTGFGVLGAVIVTVQPPGLPGCATTRRSGST